VFSAKSRREKTFCVCITFAAENFVAINREPIKNHLFLGRGFLDEAREPGFDGLQFPGVHFKVRMEANEVRESAHVRKVSWSGNLSKARQPDYVRFTIL
jgi:hypothetical protein